MFAWNDSVSMWDVATVTLRIFTYQCPRCRFTIPAKSRAKTRFDSFCPRCHRRVTIWWPSRKRGVWAARRGRARVVHYREAHTYPEAVERAQTANIALQRRLHSESGHRLQKMSEASFIPASELDSQLLRDYLEILRRQKEQSGD